jgi:hypothetical protein
MTTPARGSNDRRLAAGLMAALLAVAPAACKQAEAIEVEHYQASKITPAEEEGGHPMVTLTQLGADQIELKTEPVRDQRIPYSAVLHDADGQPYVFVNVEKLTFHREDVSIKRVAGDTVILSDGPADGTQVATVGVPQIHGAELEFGAY